MLLELEVDTDDKTDPSYGVVLFLILSAAEAVCAILCASAPVVGPQVFKEYKAHHNSTPKHTTTGASSKLATVSTSSKRFHKLSGESGDLSSDETQILPDQVQDTQHAIPLNSVNIETPARARSSQPGDDEIVVKSEVYVTRAEDSNMYNAM
ncbi:uncharacterized protein KY384_007421 [Bacidia gigantensis]|uniref:uncharacterized protein n=1 Tax=Bacidia gigantensis TaxID=2732470 RepID=UPI001D04684D|nr:uncharacterized protein KY384_007421 [Bacidia gigantensis]KAG8528503.1 hypothetical protein KY384_007421 [Bacidia gigantensis]